MTPTAWDMVLEYCSYHAVPGRSDKVRGGAGRRRLRLLLLRRRRLRARHAVASVWGACRRAALVPTPSGRVASAQERRVFDERFVRRDSAQLCDLTSAADGLEMRGLVDLGGWRGGSGGRGCNWRAAACRAQAPGGRTEQGSSGASHLLLHVLPASAASRAIARLIEGKSAEQIREAFRLPDDLSEEEKLEPLAAPLAGAPRVGGPGQGRDLGGGLHQLWRDGQWCQRLASCAHVRATFPCHPPPRAGGADPRMRMLNRLYAKRRKELQTRRQQLDAARGAAAAHPLLLDGAGEQAQRAEQQQAQDDRSLDDLLDFIESSGGSAASAATGGNSSKASGGGKAKKKKKGKQAAQQPAAGDGVAGGEQQQAQQQQRQEAAVPATAVERRDGAPPPAVQQEQQERQQKQRHQPPEEAQQQEQQQQPAAGERGDAAGAQVQAQAPLDAEVSQQLALSNAWLSQAGLGVGPLATALPPAIARYLVPPRPLGGELDAAGAPGLLQPRALGGLEAPSAAAGAADLLPAGSAAASDGHRATARAALTYRPVTVLTSLANFRGATHVQRVCPQPNPSGKGKPALPPPASGENGRDATGSASSSTSGSSGGRSSGTASPARKLPHASEPEAAAMNGLTAEVAAVVDAMQAADAEGAGQPAAAAPALGAASADAGSGGATAEQTASLPTLDEQQQQQHAAVTLQQSEPAPLPQQQERQLLLAAGEVEAVAGLLSSFLRQLGLHQALQVSSDRACMGMWPAWLCVGNGCIVCASALMAARSCPPCRLLPRRMRAPCPALPRP